MATRCELARGRTPPHADDPRDTRLRRAHRHLEPGVLAAMHEAKFFRLWIPSDTGGCKPTRRRRWKWSRRRHGRRRDRLEPDDRLGLRRSRVASRRHDGARDLGRCEVDRGRCAASDRQGARRRRRLHGRGTLVVRQRHPQQQWWAAGCVVHDGDMPRKTASGGPETRLVFFPASDGELIDTWTTGGMRGTGSHDYAIKDLFIPIERTMPVDAPSRLPDPLYNLADDGPDGQRDGHGAARHRACRDRRLCRDGRKQDVARFHHCRGEQAGDPGRCRPRRSVARAARSWLLWHGRARRGTTCRPDAPYRQGRRRRCDLPVSMR